jgi:hypothetical protein
MSAGDLSKQEAMSLAKQTGVDEMAYFVIGYMSGRGLARDFIKSTVVEYCKKISSLPATQSQKEELYLLLIDMNLGNLKERMGNLKPASVLIDPLVSKESKNIGHNPVQMPSPIIPDIKKAESNSINPVLKYGYESRVDNISQNIFNPVELKQNIKDLKEVPRELISTEEINRLIYPAPDAFQHVHKVAENILGSLQKGSLQKGSQEDNIIDKLKSLKREPDISQFEEKPKSPAYQASEDIPSPLDIQRKPENMNPNYNNGSQRSEQDIKLAHASSPDQYYKIANLPIQEPQEIRLKIPQEISSQNIADLHYAPQGNSPDQYYKLANLPIQEPEEIRLKKPQEISSQNIADLHYAPQGNYGSDFYRSYNGNPMEAKDQSNQIYIPRAELPAKRHSDHDLDHYNESMKGPQEGQGFNHYKFQIEDIQFHPKDQDQPAKKLSENIQGIGHNEPTNIQEGFRLTYVPSKSSNETSPPLSQGYQINIQGISPLFKLQPEQSPVINFNSSQPVSPNDYKSYEIEYKHQPYREQDQAQGYHQSQAEYGQIIPAKHDIPYQDITNSKNHEHMNLRGPSHIISQNASQFYQTTQSNYQAGQAEPMSNPVEKVDRNPYNHSSYSSPSNRPFDQYPAVGNYSKQSGSYSHIEPDPSPINSGLYQQSDQKSYVENPLQSPHQLHQQYHQQLPQQSPQQLSYQDIYQNQANLHKSPVYPGAQNLPQHPSYQGAQAYAKNSELQYGQFSFNQQYQAPGAGLPYQCPLCCLCQDYSDTSVISICQQKHTTHLKCIVRMAVNDLNRNTLPKQCPYPQCTAELETFKFYNDLPKDIADKLDNLAAQQLFDVTGEVLVTSPCLRCRSVIEHDKSNTCLECRYCKFSFCTKCNKEAHPGILCFNGNKYY